MKLIYLVVAILMITSAGLSSCNKADEEALEGACGFGFDRYDFMYTPPVAAGSFVPFNGTPPAQGKIGYVYSGGQVLFVIGQNYKNICSKTHTKIFYSVTFGGSEPHTIPLKVYGDAYFGFANRDVTVFEGMPQAGANIKDVMLEIGLDQQFKDKPAEINFYMNVLFNSLGSLALDSAYFVQHVSVLSAGGQYSKHGI